MAATKSLSALGMASILTAVLAAVVSVVGWVLIVVGFLEGAGSGGNFEHPFIVGIEGWVVSGALSLAIAIVGSILGGIGLARASKDPSISRLLPAWGLGLNLIGVPMAWGFEWTVFIAFLTTLAS